MEKVGQSRNILFFYVILAAVLNGCAANLQDVKGPRVSLVHITVEEAKALETAFQLELRVFNPNDIPLNIKGLECDLDLNGKPFATGVKKVDATIEAFGTDTITVVVYSSVLDTVSRIVGLIQQVQKQKKIENLTYEINGRLHIKGRPSTSIVRFKSEGNLNLGNQSI
jgi:LEA14-like dessication related protein